jgi:hypothetical protein
VNYETVLDNLLQLIIAIEIARTSPGPLGAFALYLDVLRCESISLWSKPIHSTMPAPSNP